MQFYKIDKDLVDRWLGTDNDRLVWWIDMLRMAAWKETTTNKIVLQKGQFVSTVQQLCCRWKSTAKKVRNYLDWLQQTGRITRETNNLFTVFTITEISGEKQEKGKRRTNEGQTKGKPKANQLCEKSDSYGMQGANEGQTKGKQGANEGQTNIRILDNYNNYNISLRDNITTTASARVREGETDGNDRNNGNGTDWMEIFNKLMDEHGAAIPRIKSLQGKRKAALNARIHDYGEEAVWEAIRKASASPFLNGRGSSVFVASFDWIMRPNNFPKVVEGNYDDDYHQVSLINQTQDNYATQGNYIGGDADAQRRYEATASLISRLLSEDK